MIPDGLLADRYRLGRVLGVGSTATVRLARDMLLDRLVAVKLFVRAPAGVSMVEQEREAELGWALRHPGVTALLDAGVDADTGDGQMFLVLEYVPGGDLRDLLFRDGAMDVDDVCRMGVDLAEALDHVHVCGVLHRDIKPANILISAPVLPLRVRAKLTDFGIASPIGCRESAVWVAGTAAYLSPEQAEGADATTASDVYALGLVLLECLTGRVEFPGPSATSASVRLLRDPVVPTWLPARVSAVLRSMIARRPQQRSTLPAVAEQLRKIVGELDASGGHKKIAA